MDKKAVFFFAHLPKWGTGHSAFVNATTKRSFIQAKHKIRAKWPNIILAKFIPKSGVCLVANFNGDPAMKHDQILKEVESEQLHVYISAAISRPNGLLHWRLLSLSAANRR